MQQVTDTDYRQTWTWDEFDEDDVLVIVETHYGDPVNVYGPFNGLEATKEAYLGKSWVGEPGTKYTPCVLDRA